ncbi:MAG: helical backbone metal receptor [Pseudomonadota bacterium]|nr:helical backbone metal receptor [Pseudomonadota bacterium]
MNQSPLRIASLVPSVTELVVELGLAEALVARTGFCIHPRAALREVPKVGGTKDVDLRKLEGLAPTHLIVNVDENRRETVDAVRGWPRAPRIVVTHPMRPQDNLALVAQMLHVFRAHPGVPERAQDLSQALHRELALTGPEGRPLRRVLYLIWREPWMTIARDTYLSRMLARVNWQSLPQQEGGPCGAARYPVLRGDESWLGEVDEVLLSSEPYRFTAAHLAHAQALCPAARVRRVDGELLSWYGPRAIRGLRYLRRLAATAADPSGDNPGFLFPGAEAPEACP